MNQSLSEVNVGMTSVAQSLSQQTLATGIIKDDINEIVDISNLLVKNANESKKVVASSNEHMGEIKKITEDIKIDSKSVTIEMQKLIKNSIDVQSVLEIINGIAGKTNLLAINASIEAARVGEAGQGFNVVANEIRSLADSTKQSTQQIKIILDQLTNSSNKADEQIDHMMEIMNQQSNNIESTYEELHHVSTNIYELIEQILKISERIHNVDESTKSVVESINQMSAVSQEVSASTTEVFELSSSTQDTSLKVKDAVAQIEHNMKELV